LHDENGYTIIQNFETNFYVYADKIGDELVPTNLIFGINEPQILGLPKGLIVPDNPSSRERRNKFNEVLNTLFLEREERLNREYRNKFGMTDKFQSGQRTINNIVVFVEFADKSFKNIDSIRNAKEKEFNTDALSMRSYYDEVSYGNCTINTHFYPQNSKVFISQRIRGYLEPRSASNPQGYTSNGE
jgi:hypothetical protein